jgi:WD40 repeat protein
VYDHHTGEMLRTISAASHTKPILSVAFHPSGSQLATSSADGTAKVWDIATGQELFSLEGHLDPNKSVNFVDELNTVEFSPDGSRLVTASYDRTAKIWDAATGEELLTLRGHTSWVWNATFSPDGRRVATGSRDATAKIWDAVTGEELLTLTGHTGIVTGLAFSPDGHRLATSSFDGTTRLWDLVTGTELLKWENSGPGMVHFSSDGSLLSTGNVFNQTVQVFALDLDLLKSVARQRLTRSLTTAECRQFLHLDECPVEP